MATMTIRDARISDAGRLAVLAAQLGYPVTAAEVGTRLKKYMGNGDERVIVAELSGDVVGWTSAALIDHFYSPRSIEISGLVVDSSMRGKGIGGALLDEVRRWSVSKGVSQLRLRANVIRQDAHRFYSRYGFEKTKTQYVFEMQLDKEGAQ
jgi:GNAT superfamily N-acetyltransferase